MSALERLNQNELEALQRNFSPGSKEYIAIEQTLAKAGSALSLGDVARAAGQGAWSFGDEIEAGVRTGFGFAGDYDATKAQINQEIAQAYDDYPALNAVELAAGFALPGGNVARGIKGLNAGLRGAQNIPQAIGVGAVNGAVNGAVDGIGASDGQEFLGGLYNAGKGALFGTGLGAGIGGLAPLAIRAVTGSKDPEAIIRQIAAESGLKPDEVAARMKELGPEATLADAFPVLRQATQGSVGIGGATDSVGMLAERNASAPGRLVGEVEKLTGKDIDSARLEIDARETERARVANEDYRPVDAATFMADDAAGLMENPVAKKYIQEAINAYAASSNNPYNIGQLKRMMAGDPEMDIPGAVPARILADARSLMAEASQNFREKGQAKRAMVLQDSVDQFDGLLDEVSGYTQANANYARNSQVIGAIKEGETFAQNANQYGTDRYRLRELETDPELRGALATGAASDLINDLTVSGGNRQTGSPTSRLGSAAQQQLRLEAARVPGMTDSIARENTFYDTFNQVDPKMQSKTSGAESAKEQLQQTAGVLNMANSVLNPIESAANVLGERLKLKNKDVARAMTDILLKRGMQPEEIIKLLETEQGRTALSEFLAKASKYTGGATGGVLTMTSPQ
jgi:hypothetical protein